MVHVSYRPRNAFVQTFRRVLTSHRAPVRLFEEKLLLQPIKSVEIKRAPQRTKKSPTRESSSGIMAIGMMVSHSQHNQYNQTQATSTVTGSTNNGPHATNMGNKVDPRVDSDMDHRANPASGVGGTL